MRKAVVLEIREEYAAVLTDEGLVQKIPDKSYAVGQEIVLPDMPDQKEGRSAVRRPRFTRWYRAAAAAAVILAVSGGGLYYASENAFAYSTVIVTSDDMSMELKLNKKDEVVSVKALDEKSQTTVSELHISAARRRPLPDTLDLIAEEGKEMTVTVTSGNEEHRQKLEKEVTEMLPALSGEAPAESSPAAENNTRQESGDTRYSVGGAGRNEESVPEPSEEPDGNALKDERTAGSEISSTENSSRGGGVSQQETASGRKQYGKEAAPAPEAAIPSEEKPPEQNSPSGQNIPSEQPMLPEQNTLNGSDTPPGSDISAGQSEFSGQNELPGQGMPPAADSMPPQDAALNGSMRPGF